MVPSVTRQSIMIKCNQQASVLVGNYELYYAAGLLKNLYAVPLSEDMEPAVLYETIASQLPQLEPKDEKEAHLIKLLSVYTVSSNYDEQMKELFLMGANESKLWQVII